MAQLKMQNPQNNHVDISNLHWLWSLLFGALYFAFKGVWIHFVIIFFLYWFFGLGLLMHIVYAFIARGIVRKNYLEKGWFDVTHKGQRTPPGA